jgi:hypothetical protein
MNLRGVANLEEINLMKDENGDLLADSHNILNRRKNCYLSYLIYIGSVMPGR